MGECGVSIGGEWGIVPACLPGSDGFFFRRRFLEGDRVGFAVVWGEGGGGVVAGQCTAFLRPCEAWVGEIPGNVNFDVPVGRENASECLIELKGKGLPGVGSEVLNGLDGRGGG